MLSASHTNHGSDWPSICPLHLLTYAKYIIYVHRTSFINLQVSERIYFEVPSEHSAYVTDAKNHDVRTEGMGYGMMVMVQMNNQTGFDMLWRWVKLHLYHGDPLDPLFGWSAW